MKRFLASLVLVAACSTTRPPTPALVVPPSVAAREAAAAPLDLAALREAAHRRSEQATGAPPRPSAARREAAATLGKRVIFGTSYEDLKPITEEQAFALKAIGFDVIRPTIFWYKANPERGIYDWRDIDLNIERMRVAGFEIVPSIHWAPRWASSGMPAYELYTDGCARFKKDATSVMEIEFNVDLDYCVSPPHLDPDAAFQFGVDLGKRHGRSFLAVAIGNEPGLDIYWPPVRQPDGFRRYVVEFVWPMTRGIRLFNRHMQFVGPEADSAVVIAELLALEAAYDVELFDAISWHPYPWAPEWRHVFERIKNEFEPAVVAHRGGRAIWYSECGGMPDPVAFVREIIAAQQPGGSLDGATMASGDFVMVSIADFRQWFEPGSWDANRPVLNARGKEMRELIASVTAGRKMKRHL